MSGAGNIKIDVRDPYPVWCDIWYKDKQILMLHHTELLDLQYAVKKAILEAKGSLGEKDRNELEI